MESTQPSQIPQTFFSNQHEISHLKLIIIVVSAFVVLLTGLLLFVWDQSNKTRDKNEILQKEMQDLKNNNKILENTNKALENSQKELESSSYDICVDADGGKDYEVNGAIEYKKVNKKGSTIATSNPSDDCVNTFIGGQTKNVLREYYCDPNNQVQYSYFSCPNGCLKGACLK